MHLVDLHTHVLPGLDDGAGSVQEAVEMLQAAFQGGVRTVVATPHMFSPWYPNSDVDEVREAFTGTVAELARLSQKGGGSFLNEINLALGAENYVTSEFLEALEKGQVLSLNDSRYLLVEFSPHLSWYMVRVAIQRIFGAGYVPVIAHVERYLGWAGKRERVGSLVEQGCLIQVNAESLSKSAFAGARKISYALLKRGWVHVVASDSHGTGDRRVTLSSAWQPLATFSSAAASALMVLNPTAILRDRPSELQAPTPRPDLVESLRQRLWRRPSRARETVAPDSTPSEGVLPWKGRD